jgi:hypothetical protein
MERFKEGWWFSVAGQLYGFGAASFGEPWWWFHGFDTILVGRRGYGASLVERSGGGGAKWIVRRILLSTMDMYGAEIR